MGNDEVAKILDRFLVSESFWKRGSDSIQRWKMGEVRIIALSHCAGNQSLIPHLLPLILIRFGWKMNILRK
jgi:hypothetical protein